MSSCYDWVSDGFEVDSHVYSGISDISHISELNNMLIVLTLNETRVWQAKQRLNKKATWSCHRKTMSAYAGDGKKNSGEMFVSHSNQARGAFSKGDAVDYQNSWEDTELQIMKWNLYLATLKLQVSLLKQQCLWKSRNSNRLHRTMKYGIMKIRLTKGNV